MLIVTDESAELTEKTGDQYWKNIDRKIFQPKEKYLTLKVIRE
jgi:hypothetical protein